MQAVHQAKGRQLTLQDVSHILPTLPTPLVSAPRMPNTNTNTNTATNPARSAGAPPANFVVSVSGGQG
jgi:hypothetical protein